MRWIYMGTPQYAATILDMLLSAGKKPYLVVSQPDRPAGRKRALTPPPVKTLAQKAGLEILQPEKITAEARDFLIGTKPDLIVVAAYGKILRPALLAGAALGCVNAHASLLPAYRGAAPVNWAIINGETSTGITLIKMDEGVDTGPMLGAREVAIEPQDNVASLTAKLAEAAGALLVEIIDGYCAGEVVPQTQPETGVSYAPMLRKEDGEIDWRKSAPQVANHIRGVNPWPGAYTFWGDNKIKILAAEPIGAAGTAGCVLQAKKELVVAAGYGAVRLLKVQMQGKKAMDAAAFLNGVKVCEGDRFGQET